jgi:hypothetical protein
VSLCVFSCADYQKKPKQKKIDCLTFINNLFFIIYPNLYKRDRMINKTEINPKRISVVRIKTS